MRNVINNRVPQPVLALAQSVPVTTDLIEVHLATQRSNAAYQDEQQRLMTVKIRATNAAWRAQFAADLERSEAIDALGTAARAAGPAASAAYSRFLRAELAAVTAQAQIKALES